MSDKSDIIYTSMPFKEPFVFDLDYLDRFFRFHVFHKTQLYDQEVIKFGYVDDGESHRFAFSVSDFSKRMLTVYRDKNALEKKELMKKISAAVKDFETGIPVFGYSEAKKYLNEWIERSNLSPFFTQYIKSTEKENIEKI